MILSYSALSSRLKEIKKLQKHIEQSKCDAMLKDVVAEFLEGSTLILEKIKKTKKEDDEERMEVLEAIGRTFFYQHLVDDDTLYHIHTKPNGTEQEPLFDLLIQKSTFSDTEKKTLIKDFDQAQKNVDIARMILEEPEDPSVQF